MAKTASRKLAAIMFTDMVGYTALMQEDESRAKRDRDRHRKVLQEFIKAHQGDILQYYGDGTLTIFESSIEAVKSALEIQLEFQKEPRIPGAHYPNPQKYFVTSDVTKESSSSFPQCNVHICHIDIHNSIRDVAIV